MPNGDDHPRVDGHLSGYELNFVYDADAMYAEPIRRALKREVAGFDDMTDADRVEALVKLAEARPKVGPSMRIPGTDTRAYAGTVDESDLEARFLGAPMIEDVSRALGGGWPSGGLPSGDQWSSGGVPIAGALGNKALAVAMLHAVGERRPDWLQPSEELLEDLRSIVDLDPLDVIDPPLVADGHPFAQDWPTLRDALEESICAYANDKWGKNYTSFYDAMGEDLLAMGESSPVVRLPVERNSPAVGQRANKKTVSTVSVPMWLPDLVDICREAIKWLGWTREYRETVPKDSDVSPEYLACVAADAMARMFPTLEETEALRWLVCGDILVIPDLVVRASGPFSFTVSTGRSFDASSRKYENGDVWKDVLEHRRDAEPYAVPLNLTGYVDDRVEDRYGIGDRHETTAQDYLSYQVAHILRHDLEEDVGAVESGAGGSWKDDEKTTRREAIDGPRVYRPRPHEGWLGCVEMCLGIALRELLGQEGARACGKRKAGEPDWSQVTGYLGNERRKAQKFIWAVASGSRSAAVI